MIVADATRTAPVDVLGTSMLATMEDLFPLCRSLTGDGVRETLAWIGKDLPLELTEVPSGTNVLDWIVPQEWNVRDAWIADSNGRRVVDFQASNLHVVHYSVPVRGRLSLDELRPHLHTLADHPTLVPYRTSYYAPAWGFCLSQATLDGLVDGDYEVCIDSTLADGSLTYGEVVLPGRSRDEILLSSHICHPSLANDNLSGVVVAAEIARHLAMLDHHFTYRFVFAPGTIGAITWLAQHEDVLPRIRGGLVLACVGDEGPLAYKRSRRGDTLMDRATAHVLGQQPEAHVIEFTPFGGDERQYCSPGFDLPVGGLTRSGHDRNELHHTSADNLSLMSPAALAGTVRTVLEILSIVDGDTMLTSTCMKGEPQLSRRGLYREFGGRADRSDLEAALLWVLNMADGTHTALDVAQRSGVAFASIQEAVAALERVDLLHRSRPGGPS